LYEDHRITHGDFHNIAIMVIFGIFMAFLLHPFGIKFVDGFFFSIIGFGAHLFEDALGIQSGIPIPLADILKSIGSWIAYRDAIGGILYTKFLWNYKYGSIDCRADLFICGNNNPDVF